METTEEIWGKPAHLEIDRHAFQFAYRSVIGSDDFEQRRYNLEQALLKVMDNVTTAYCMSAIHAAMMGENRRCREEFNNEKPHVLNEDGDWGFAKEAQ
jgi:hypothetical protein